MVQPSSIAIAACWASATSFPVSPASRHNRSNMSRWSGPGPRTRAAGRSTSEETNANDFWRVDGGSKIRRLVAARTIHAKTRTESANVSECPMAKRVSYLPRTQRDQELSPRHAAVYQDIDIRKQHVKSVAQLDWNLALVFTRVKCTWPVEVRCHGQLRDAVHSHLAGTKAVPMVRDATARRPTSWR